MAQPLPIGGDQVGGAMTVKGKVVPGPDPRPDPRPADPVYFHHPGVATVRWDPAVRAAHIEWQGWANPAEYRAANDAIIVALKANHGSKALGDTRLLKVIQQSDQDWSNKDWFPRILAAGLTQMALVIPQSGLAKMNVDRILSRVPGTELDVAYFATLREARSWLAETPAKQGKVQL